MLLTGCSSGGRGGLGVLVGVGGARVGRVVNWPQGAFIHPSPSQIDQKIDLGGQAGADGGVGGRGGARAGLGKDGCIGLAAMSASASELDPTRGEGGPDVAAAGEDVDRVLEVKVLNAVRRRATAPSREPFLALTTRRLQGVVPVPVQPDDRIGTVKGVLADRHFVRLCAAAIVCVPRA